MRHILAGSLVLAAFLSGGRYAQAQVAFNQADFTAWIGDSLGAMADTGKPIAKRAEAREEIAYRIGPGSALSPNDRNIAAKIAADKIRPLIDSKDRVTALFAIMLAAKAKNLQFVQLLADAVTNGQAMIRYWAARGLAEAQPEMYLMGDKFFFDSPLKAMAAQAVKEDTPAVVQEIYRALGRIEADQESDADKNRVMFGHFMAAFSGRVKRLDAGKVDGVAAEVAGLTVASLWEQYYRSDNAARAEVLTWEGQLLKWAVQSYELRADLNDDRKAELEQVIVRSAEVLSSQVGNQSLANEVRQNLLTQPNMDMLLLKVTEFVGGPGMGATGYTLQKFGVKELADPSWLKAQTTQPG